MNSDQIQLFHGEANETSADFYLQLHGSKSSLRADVSGPFCSIAKTLRTTVAFQPAGADLWRARMVDPCFWSPDYPALYRVTIRGESLDAEVHVGIRHFGCVARNLRLNGKRWVLRGAANERVASDDLAEWREARMVMRVRQPTRSLLDACARTGVMLLVDLPHAADLDDLVHVAHCAAATMVIVPNDTSIESLRGRLRNIVFMKQYDAHNRSGWEDADVILCHTDSEMPADARICGDRPVMAIRVSTDFADVRAARAACDRLQRDLAPEFDLSGYIV